VEREVFLVLDGIRRVAWPCRRRRHGHEPLPGAWRRALQAGAVKEGDAGAVQFRSYTPDVSALRKVALRAVAS
jgi:hypothetical protein